MKKTDNKSRRKMNRRHNNTSIPAFLLYDRTLTLTEAFVLAEIHALDGEDGCYAMNVHFATLLRISADRAGKIISSLVKKGRLSREIMPSKKGKKRFLSVVWEIDGHTVETPDGHTVDIPDGIRYKQPMGPGESTVCYIEENNIESNRERETPSPIFDIEVLKGMIPNTAAGKRLRQSFEQAGLLLSIGFERWMIVECIGRFTKSIDLTMIQLKDYQSNVWEKFDGDGELLTEALQRIVIAGTTKGCLPSISRIRTAVRDVQKQRATQAATTEKPAEKADAYIPYDKRSDAELAEIMKKQPGDDTTNNFKIKFEQKVVREIIAKRRTKAGKPAFVR